MAKLPPDPEHANEDRAAWAQVALDAFQNETGAEDEDAIADLLADLMHLADRRPKRLSFESQLQRAYRFYKVETAAKPTTATWATKEDEQ